MKESLVNLIMVVKDGAHSFRVTSKIRFGYLPVAQGVIQKRNLTFFQVEIFLIYNKLAVSDIPVFDLRFTAAWNFLVLSVGFCLGTF